MIKKFLDQTRFYSLRRRLQQDPYYRFQSFEELQLAAKWGTRIEANTASTDQWLRLPGISIHQANLLAKLTANGLSFNCIEDVAAALGMPTQQIQPWEVVLQFCYYEAQNSLEPIAIDVNIATATELATIPVIDTFLARAIVHYRQTEPYQNLADLQQRLRLTTQATTELLHYLKF